MATRRRLSRSALTRQRTQLRARRRLRRGSLAVRITVHRGSDRPDCGAEDVHDAMVVACLRSGRRDVQVTVAGAFGPRSEEPLVTVESVGEEALTYSRISTGVVKDLFRSHVMHGEILSAHAWVRGMPGWPESQEVESGRSIPHSRASVPHVSEHPWFALQRAWSLRRRGRIDPASLEDALAMDAYEGLTRALFELEPEQILAEVERSELRDCLDSELLVGARWRATVNRPGRCRTVVCRAKGDRESDPVSRSVLGSDPHAVLEGMAIAARAVGAHQGVILCHGLPVAAGRLENALIQSHGVGLLGPAILGSDMDFTVILLGGADGLNQEDTTALARALEHSAETYASLGALLYKGPEAFRALGTSTAPGTKLLHLGGDLRRPGLVEVPYGISLRRIVEDLAGGSVDGQGLEAIRLGGAEGAILTGESIDLPLKPLAQGGSGLALGTGELVALRQGLRCHGWQ